ncbi:hypothetical protein KFL_003030110 [Klebsormidium nitens]|uniref:SHSP domain-containing protein n=1 Tax=Klebsormidium nitens TaxID=105231 RepID=A0A1Y1IEY1_KLENI|nr:hypothetical protein KFL_003030110 [Klebsormidium nitens]|eukprot:GAQ86668.1 hypothetical protein KFL_003030110 [Klebsormidium nitens]
MASSALAGLLRGTAPLVRALSPTRARPLPGVSISQAAFGRTESPGNASRLVRRFATAAAADQGRGSRRAGDASGASAVGDAGDAGGLSDVAVSGDRGTGSDVARRDRDRGQGYGLTRGGGGRGGRGGALSPFSFDLGPLFSARGDRDLLNMMDDFFLTPSRFFDQALRDIFQSLPVQPPRLDINESDKEYTIKMQLPGLQKDEVNITVDPDDPNQPTLRITAHHEAKEGEDQRFWEDVDTRLRLPDGTNPEDVRAEFKDGTLTIHVPKEEAPENPEPKRIPVHG